MGIFDKLQNLFQNDRVDVDERFELLRKAVSGTMSKFYMARDRKTGDVVGLKIADREKVETFEKRFRGLKKPSEGEIAISLNHPRIVKTLEYGRTNKDVQFIVMEYVHGPGLHMLLNRRDPVIEGCRSRLVREMAEAIAYVHERSFIHRDVCPRNFIYETGTGELKLIDFGLTLPSKRDFMQPGNRTGTPLYMAPEVLRRRWTDPRLDIFALGVSAYQVCTYELPWPVSETTGQAALAHDTQEPANILQYRPKLNRTLAAAIMKSIEPDAKNRPQTAGQFLRMIREVKQDDEP